MIRDTLPTCIVCLRRTTANLKRVCALCLDRGKTPADAVATHHQGSLTKLKSSREGSKP